MCKRVKVEGAPGYANFEGELVLRVDASDGRSMSVISWESDEYRDECNPQDSYYKRELFVIPSRYVEEV